jgi:hypothetical protein
MRLFKTFFFTQNRFGMFFGGADTIGHHLLRDIISAILPEKRNRAHFSADWIRISVSFPMSMDPRTDSSQKNRFSSQQRFVCSGKGS